jgi:MFS family permease
MAKGPGILLLARMLTGIGTTGALTAALSLASDLSLPGQRGRAVLIATLGKTAGVAAGSLAAGMLLGMFAAPRAPLWFGEIAPWRSAQWTLGLASIVLIAPLLVLREPSRHEVESGRDAPLRVVLGELLRRRGFLVPLFVGQTSVLMADAAAAIWAAPILERKFELQPAALAGWLGAIVLVTGIVASIFGGVIADWGQKTGYRGGLLIGAVAAALIGVPAALFPVMAGVPAFAVMFAVLIFAGAITGLITSAALTVFLPNELRGLSISAFIAVAALIGFGVAPPIVNQMSLILGGAQHLAKALAIFGVAAGILSVIGFGLAMRRAPLAPTPQTGMRTAVR